MSEDAKGDKMNWGLIPEIFYDVIGRVMPGSLLIVIGVIVVVGPTTAFKSIPSKLPEVSVSILLFLALASYFVAVVVKEMSDFVKAPNPKKRNQTDWDDPKLYTIRRLQPQEAARLLKIQAEKNFCEVLVPGLAILVMLDLILLWNNPLISLNETIRFFLKHPISGFNESIGLLLGMLVVSRLCWSWKVTLEEVYESSLNTLYLLVPDNLKYKANVPNSEPRPPLLFRHLLLVYLMDIARSWLSTQRRLP